MVDTRSNGATSKDRTFTWLVAALFLLGAVLVRALYLDSFPAFIHNDESATAIYITPPFLGANPDSPFYGLNNYGGHANFGAWLASLYLRAFGGQTLWAIRTGSMVCGVLSIILLGLFIRSWLGMRTALFFLAGVLPFHLHVHYSRTGFIYIQAVVFIALVTYLFGRFARAPSAKNGFLLGISTGFALMVYSATHVLPGVLAIAIPAVLLSPAAKTTFKENRIRGSAVALASLITGALLAFGQHLWHFYKGFSSSRFATQSIFKEESFKIWTRELGREATVWDILWGGLLRTCKFFYHSDSSGQYGRFGPQLEWYGATVALLGLLVLLYRVARLDPNSIYIVALAAGTVLGSALMIEANFSPHLIVFSILIPLACAVGLSAICQTLRLRSAWITTIIAIVVLVPWARWNFALAMKHNENKQTLDTFIHHLPIPRDSVKTLVNFTPLITDFGESFYMLRYPHGKGSKVEASDLPSQVLELASSQRCPCVAIVTNPQSTAITAALTREKKTFQVFPFARVDAAVYHIE